MVKTGRLFAGAVAAAAVMLAASSVAAKEGHHNDPQQHLNMLSKKLELTDEQRVQVEQIMNDYHGRMEALHGQMEAMKKEKHEKINAVLTPAQQEKFKNMKHHKGRRSWFKKRSSQSGEGGALPQSYGHRQASSSDQEGVEEHLDDRRGGGAPEARLRLPRGAAAGSIPPAGLLPARRRLNRVVSRWSNEHRTIIRSMN